MYKQFGRKKHLRIIISRAVGVSKVNSILLEIPSAHLLQKGNNFAWKEDSKRISTILPISAFTMKTQFLIESNLKAWQY